MVAVRDADGRRFSTVAAGIVMAEGSVSFPLPWNSTLILLLARPGPEPIEIVQPSPAQLGIIRLRIGRVGHVFEPTGGALRRPPARILRPLAENSRVQQIRAKIRTPTHEGRSEERRVGKECRSRW